MATVATSHPAPHPAAPAPSAGETLPGGSPSHMSVLVVGRSGDTKEVASTLSSFQYEVTTASSLEDALQCQGFDGCFKFSLVLASLSASDTISVDSVVRAVRSYSAFNVPVVVMSESEDENVVRSCLKAGASDHIMLPARPQELQALWKNVWRGGDMAGEEADAGDSATNTRTHGGDAESSPRANSVESDEGCTESMRPSSLLQQGTSAAPAPMLVPAAGHALVRKLAAYRHDDRRCSRDSSASDQSSGPVASASGRFWSGQHPDTVTFSQLRRWAPTSSAFRSFCPAPKDEAVRDKEDATWATEGAASHPNASLIAQAVASDAAAVEFYTRTIAAFGRAPAAAAAPARGGEGSEGGDTGSGDESSEDAPRSATAPRAAAGSGGCEAAGDAAEQRRLNALDAKERRRVALEKFRQKRKDRCFDKKVRYESRKRLADQRPRVRGQFVKACDLEEYYLQQASLASAAAAAARKGAEAREE